MAGTRRAPRRSRVPLPVIVCALVLLAALNADTVHANFTGNTSNTNNMAGAAVFTTVPQQVSSDGALFEHRGDEAASDLSTSTATDSTSNNRPGTYSGPTNGSSTWWRFTDASGTTAEDSSGNTNVGTLTNGPSWSTGPAAGALSFDGSNDYVASAQAAVTTNSSFTVSAKVRLGSAAATGAMVSQPGTTASGFYLGFNQPTNKWRFTMPQSDVAAPTADYVDSSETPVVGTWTLITAVYDSSASLLKLYVNGRLSATAAHSTTWSATGSLLAGRRMNNTAYTEYFNGRLSDVRTWRRAFSSTDVATLYNTPTTEWDFDENSGTTSADLSGNRNNATLVSGATWATGHTGSSSASFDGVDDYAIGTDPGLRTDVGFTVTAWVYLTSTSGTKTVLSIPGAHSSGIYLKYDSGYSPGTWSAMMLPADSSTYTTDYTAVSNTGAVTTNTWVHLAAVYDPTSADLRLYVNGVPAGTLSDTSAWAATGALTVGRSLFTDSQVDYFSGRIDDVRTYDHALTDTGIADVYRGWTTRYDFDEGTGSTAGDASGSHNPATMANTTWSSAGANNSAAVFNGTSSTVTGTTTAIRTDQSYTVTAWAYPTSNTSNRTVVSQDGAHISPFYLEYLSVCTCWSMTATSNDASGAAGVYATSGTATLNAWTHLVGIYDTGAGQIRLYVNGVLAASASFSSGWRATGAITVGRSYYNTPSGFFSGKIDEVRTAQRVFTATEVASLYTDTTVADYAFDEGAGATAADASTRNNTGTLTNGPTWTASGHTSSAVVLDGSNDYVAGTSNLIKTNGSFTVAAWVYPISLPTGGSYIAHIVLAQEGSQTDAFALGYSNSANRWMLDMPQTDTASPTEDIALSTAAPTLNTWVQLVGVYDASLSESRLYVNGVLASRATHTSTWQATGSFVVGRAKWAGSTNGTFFNGRVDDARAYNRALGPLDVAMHYTTGRVSAPSMTQPAFATAGVTGALQGAQQGQQSSTAIAYSGLNNGYNQSTFTNPTAFTIECWFRATGTRGGGLIGFNTTATGLTSLNYDRILYLDSGNRITFGVNDGGTKTVRSTATYNDGAWHHVVASFGAAGMQLYLDGEPDTSNTGVGTLGSYTGYWRWAGFALGGGWPNQPTSSYFVGTLDEVAVYPTQLTDQQVRRHFYANH